jgi:hypothetical protein
MNRRKLSQNVINFAMGILLLVGCSEPAATLKSLPSSSPVIPITSTLGPISQQGSQQLMEEWGFLQLLTAYDQISSDQNGKITINGDLELDFAFQHSPKMIWVGGPGQSYFKFDKPMPKGSSSSTVIFATSDVRGAMVKIPRFAISRTNSENPKITCVSSNQFHDYEGWYDFKICMTVQGFENIRVVDMNVFSDGSEHHIYGKVEMFGVRFTNNFEEPLVFRIDRDKYVYIQGKGRAKTEDGVKVLFGQ